MRGILRKIMKYLMIRKTVEFTLNDNIKWQDGEDFSADDIIFTLEAVAKN